MSASDDLPVAMAFLSSDRSERIITGSTPIDDLPDESARVARLLTALRSTTPSGEGGEQEAVASLMAAIAAAPVPLDAARRHHMLRQLLTAKAVAATAAVLLLGTGAAAATGSLPDAAQGAVSHALSHVNVSVPDPNDHASDRAHPGDHGTAVGPDATGPAMKGLCTAWAARGKDDSARGNSADSVAFTNLRNTAHDAGMLVKDYCHDVLTAAHSASGGSDDSGTSADHRQNPDHPTSDHGAAVDTPNSGGIGTGTTASDGANSGGTEHAPPAASSGSGNADGHRHTPPSP